MTLAQLIGKRLGIGGKRARVRILAGAASVNGSPCPDPRQPVSRFDGVDCDGAIVQPALPRLCLMLHKPAGILSATSDPQHRTVLDLIDHPDKSTLHLAGRLDRSSTGLVLLSNDGNWSSGLTDPEEKVEKVYLVGTDRDIPPESVARFAEGFAFATEGIVTRPALLEILEPRLARVTLWEGRYHQIKRMFHRLDGIRLTSLHRIRVGPWELPEDLGPGEWRLLEPASGSAPGIV